MFNHLRRRFWVEAGLAVSSAALLLVTMISRDWIEVVLKFDADNHSGSLEWTIAVALAALSTAFTVLACRELHLRSSS
jgi:hypothetical protein